MNQRIKKIKQVAGESEVEKLQLLSEAKAKAAREVKKKATVPNQRAFKKADRELAEFIHELEIKYLHEKPPFKNVAAVLKYFSNQDYEIKKTKVYEDAKTGKLKVRRDGKINFADVEDYIINEQLKKRGEYSESGENLARQKKFLETQLIEEKIHQQRVDREIKQGKYVLIDRVEMEQAIKARVFKAGIKHMFKIYMREFLATVKGDLNKSDDSIKFWMEKADDLFDDFANMNEIRIKMNVK